MKKNIVMFFVVSLSAYGAYGIPTQSNIRDLGSPERSSAMEIDSGSDPLFALQPTDKLFTSDLKIAAQISESEAQELLDRVQMSPNGYLRIRMYLGPRGSKGYPNHAFGVKPEFATVSWFKDGKIQVWDAFIMSSGYPQNDAFGGTWSPAGNFTITELFGAGYRSHSIYSRLRDGTKVGAPMPWAMDVAGGVKIHVDPVTGYPVSHGCFRLPDSKGGFLNQVVRKIGMQNVLVTAYRAKAQLDADEMSAKAINDRLARPVANEKLRFYGFGR